MNFSIPIDVLPDYLKLQSISSLLNKKISLDFLTDDVLDKAFLFFLHDFYDSINKVMMVDFDELVNNFGESKKWPKSFPNAFPNRPPHIYTPNYIYMLKRYCVFSYLFANGNTVLDSCCGSGWGSYILSQRAKKVLSIDNSSPSLDFAKLCFREANNINWILGDATNLTDFREIYSTKIDVVVATETIEHFDKEFGIKYIENMFSVLDTGGIFCGTTQMFNTRSEAENSHYFKNIKSHLYVWTTAELESEFQKFSKEFTIINNSFFIARKS